MASLKRKRHRGGTDSGTSSSEAAAAAGGVGAATAAAPLASGSPVTRARRATRQTSTAPLPVLPDPEPPRRRRRRDSTGTGTGLATDRQSPTSPPLPPPGPPPPPPPPPTHRDKENIPMQSNSHHGHAPIIKTRLTRHTGFDFDPPSSVPTPPSSSSHSNSNSNSSSHPPRPHAASSHSSSNSSHSGPRAITPARSVTIKTSTSTAHQSPLAQPHQAPTASPLRAPAPTPTTKILSGPLAGGQARHDSTTTHGHGRSATGPVVLPHHSIVGQNKIISMAPSVPLPIQHQQHQQQQQQQHTHRSPIARPGPSGGKSDRPERAPGERPDRNIDKVVLGDICFRAWYPSYYGKEVLGEGPPSVGTTIANGTNPSNQAAHGHQPHHQPPMLDRLYVCPCCFKYSKELVAWRRHVCLCEARGHIPGTKVYVHPKGRRTVLVPTGPAPKPGRGKRGSIGQKMVEEVIQDEGEWSIWKVDGAEDMLFCQNLSLFAKLFLDNKSVFFDVSGFHYFLLVFTPPDPPTDLDSDVTEVVKPRGQVVGFFSKEKMSWDNNNLACILIFPPWQRKGLGALLMGVSYEISRREGIIGGPEKPISELGKKGYKRFWAGEIARWLLSLEPTGTTPGEETVVDIEDCSKATWIAPDDCLAVLREMDVAEDAGKGPPKPKIHEPSEEEVGTTPSEAPAPAPAAAAAVVVEDVPRVRITLEAVHNWVTRNRISLERTCDPAGFIDDFVMEEPSSEEEG
ncbi:acyl-CoA N-acyltransferase [Neurospora crassa]|nr:acyl-CoA N-acyltransferase [Neurospora crassa]KAK3487107.1 acyl-CoA N-acyltransferase [Neurospora crassa]